MKIRYFLMFLLISFGAACNLVDRAFERTPPTPAAASLYIPPTCAGKPIATMPALSETAQPTSAALVNPEISPTDQLRVFDALTKKIDEVYLDPHFNSVDWPAIVAQYRTKIAAGLNTESFYIEMQRLMSELKDEHSAFRPPRQSQGRSGHLRRQSRLCRHRRIHPTDDRKGQSVAGCSAARCARRARRLESAR